MDHCLGHIWVNGPTVAGSWVTSMTSATTTGSGDAQALLSHLKPRWCLMDMLTLGSLDYHQSCVNFHSLAGMCDNVFCPLIAEGGHWNRAVLSQPHPQWPWDSCPAHPWILQQDRLLHSLVESCPCTWER